MRNRQLLLLQQAADCVYTATNRSSTATVVSLKSILFDVSICQLSSFSLAILQSLPFDLFVNQQETYTAEL